MSSLPKSVLILPAKCKFFLSLCNTHTEAGPHVCLSSSAVTGSVFVLHFQVTVFFEQPRLRSTLREPRQQTLGFFLNSRDTFYSCMQLSLKNLSGYTGETRAVAGDDVWRFGARREPGPRHKSGRVGLFWTVSLQFIWRISNQLW